eukprot:655531-Pelagomonas_calceolata.AAC.18
MCRYIWSVSGITQLPCALPTSSLRHMRTPVLPSFPHAFNRVLRYLNSLGDHPAAPCLAASPPPTLCGAPIPADTAAHNGGCICLPSCCAGPTLAGFQTPTAAVAAARGGAVRNNDVRRSDDIQACNDLLHSGSTQG